MTEPFACATTRDAFYGGRLVLTQPAKGHRSGTDAVLLAAAAPAGFAGRCYDIGSGVGVVGLGIALLHPEASVVLAERDAATVDIARSNATTMARSAAVTVVACDVLDGGERRRMLPEKADLVVTNPPFRDPRRSRPSPDPLRQAAHVLAEGIDLKAWVDACLDCLAQRGVLVLVHTADVLPGLLATLVGRTGAIVVKPVLPRANSAAHRVLVRAVKGSNAPFTLASPLVLHDETGRFTEEAACLHRGDATLSW